ncbi:MAG: hypothetical protein H6525_00050 [Actinobacteria bacterium]|nr:hypothetical protein [Actinomycetota bacterium]MCB9411234.1 hypothetical protein [Actinomycetota bacterium]
MAAGCAVLAGLLGWASPGAAVPPTPAEASQTCQLPTGLLEFTSGDQPRTYLIQFPAAAGPATPMVISMHGAGGTAPGQQLVTGLSEDEPAPDADGPVGGTRVAAEVAAFASLGTREGFIAVFPQARAEDSYIWDAAPDSIDVDFVVQLTEYLHAQGCSSPAITSVNGFSMGAMMTSRLMCVRPELYSGAAMVGGVLNPTAQCQVPPDKEILVVHGAADTVVPLDGSLNPYLEAAAGPDSVSTVDRVGIAANWASNKDCPSPGWTTPGWNRVTDLSCPRSTTLAVVGLVMAHTWDSPGINTSRLVWAALRPPPACIVTPPSPPNPAMAAALDRAAAEDIAFRVEFGNLIKAQMSCNPHVRSAVVDGIRTTVAADPNGMVAQQIAFAIRETARIAAG